MTRHKIQPLPSEVVAKIKSSTSITHLNGVIAELVKNSLDANAQSIFVTVDYRRGGCVVEDDGDGILPAEFAPDGGLGKIHRTYALPIEGFHADSADTSKLLSQSPVHGRRGSFLASLSALALLTITSHHLHNVSTNTVIFHHSTPVARLLPAPSHHGLRASEHGTRVTVNDLFGNMPVRVKNRALTLQKPDGLDRQWDDLKHLLISLLITHDDVLKLVISDADKERKLTIRPHGQGAQANGDLNLTRLSSILSQAGLVDTQSPSQWHAVSAVALGLTVHAGLSLVPSPSKKVQFISLGIDPVFAQNQTNVLYSEVNRLFAMSDFGTTGGTSPFTNEATDLDGRRGKSMQVNKWPMFYIRINSGPIANDPDLPESDKSLQRILDVVSLMINEFLKEHNMRPRGGKRKRQDSVQDTESPSPGKPRQRAANGEFSGNQIRFPSFSRSTVGTHFGSWSRVKSGKSRAAGLKAQGVTAEPVKNTVAQSTDTREATSDSVSEFASERANTESRTEEVKGDAIIPWIDPHTGVSHWVNSRTGQSVNVRPSAASALANRPRSNGSLIRRLDSTKLPATGVPQQNTWLENLLDDWKNPVFGRAEKPINVVDTETDDTSQKLCGLDNFGVSRYRGKLRKDDLAAARVIGQVDQKFILVDMSAAATEPTMVLIDQHAADERCRVESLFEEFFDPNDIRTIQVDPVIFDIANTEILLFRKQQELFRFWGIEYAVEQGTRSSKASVTVSKLPAMIAERCRTEPELIINIIRGEIWKRAENGSSRPSSPAVGRAERKGWIARLASCPTGILDLLNSRACRTAIMFNDVLSLDECRNLVRRLATCVFPFQCAHGRPSMVPLVDLRGTDAGDAEEWDVGFADAFKRWQSK
jgi:DNA mismatch repair protein MLH3